MKISDYEKIKIGDTFGIDIESEKYPSYNNQSLIINVVDKYLSKEFPERKTILVSIFLMKKPIKLFDEKNVDVNNCICTKIIPIEGRLLPIPYGIPVRKHLEAIDKIKVYPDEGGRLYQYFYEILIEDQNDVFSDYWTYVGNYSLHIPKANYVPHISENIPFIFVNSTTSIDFVNTLLECYENNNLRKGLMFNDDYYKGQVDLYKKMLYYEIISEEELNKTIGAMPKIAKLKEENNTEVDEEPSDTITYVSSENNKEQIILEENNMKTKKINWKLIIIIFIIILIYIWYLYDRQLPDKMIPKNYIKIIDKSSTEFSIDMLNYYKLYYNEENDSFFIKNKHYKKVQEDDIEYIYSYFNFIYKEYYDEEIFPKDYSIKSIITTNDYYYINDDCDKYNIFKRYDSFEFFYYDIDTHSLYVFGI